MGKFYDSDAWLPSRINDFHDFTKKYDPIGHYSVGNPLKTGDWLVKHTGEELADHEIGTNNNTRIANKASENQGNFGASATRAGSIAALIYGGMSAYGGGGEASPGGYEYIDSGTVVEGADPFSFGSGTDPNFGTVDFGNQAFDFGQGGMKGGGAQGGNPWMRAGMQGLGTMNGGQGGGLSGSYGGQQGMQEKNLGNQGLYQQLQKLVESQSATPVNQKPDQPSLLKSQSNLYQAAQNFGLSTDDATMGQMDALVAQGYSPETAALVLKQRNGGQS